MSSSAVRNYLLFPSFLCLDLFRTETVRFEFSVTRRRCPRDRPMSEGGIQGRGARKKWAKYTFFMKAATAIKFSQESSAYGPNKREDKKLSKIRLKSVIFCISVRLF